MVEIIGGPVIQRAAFGNENFSIPLEGMDTSTAGYNGTHPPIFIYTGFPVAAAVVAFEREYGEEDCDVYYTYQDCRAAARIRVRAPIDPTLNGFYVDFGQRSDWNGPFILRFNWKAVGYRARYGGP
jgi:hypothetical protein